jgi:uncharacterized alkaline shock family protein YloU
MEGHSVISVDVLARYAADAALGIVGVRGVVEGSRSRHQGVKVVTDDEAVAVELHLAVDWGLNVADIGAAVQMRVAEYLATMADLTPATVDVIVDEIGPPPEGV